MLIPIWAVAEIVQSGRRPGRMRLYSGGEVEADEDDFLESYEQVRRAILAHRDRPIASARDIRLQEEHERRTRRPRRIDERTEAQR
jgi:hypothetical protein